MIISACSQSGNKGQSNAAVSSSNASSVRLGFEYHKWFQQEENHPYNYFNNFSATFHCNVGLTFFFLFSTKYSRLLWMADMAHLEISAGEPALHEAGDCLCVTGGLCQVHLHSEPAAEPERKEILQIKQCYYMSEGLRWCWGEGTLLLQVKSRIQLNKGPQEGDRRLWRQEVWGGGSSNGCIGGWAEVTYLFLMCCREPRQQNCPLTMMARRLHSASHSSMLETNRGS